MTQTELTNRLREALPAIVNESKLAPVLADLVREGITKDAGREPLGLVPQHVAIARGVDIDERARDVLAAVGRYATARYIVPKAWLAEAGEHIKRWLKNPAVPAHDCAPGRSCSQPGCPCYLEPKSADKVSLAVSAAGRVTVVSRHAHAIYQQVESYSICKATATGGVLLDQYIEQEKAKAVAASLKTIADQQAQIAELKKKLDAAEKLAAERGRQLAATQYAVNVDRLVCGDAAEHTRKAWAAAVAKACPEVRGVTEPDQVATAVEIHTAAAKSLMRERCAAAADQRYLFVGQSDLGLPRHTYSADIGDAIRSLS